jgi:release factor glutamine methyltransferase
LAWTVQAVLEAAEAVVVKRGSGPARVDLARCLAGVLGVSRLHLLLDYERPLSEDERASYRARFQRLLDGEPLAYVMGRREFFGRSFRVTPDVLIPRPETETLVSAALEALPEAAHVFEPCTGSGCVAITLALERPDLVVTASDVSAPALGVAAENAASLGAEVEWLKGSFWQPVAGRVFGGLVANPPYVDPARPDLFDASLRFEPEAALFSPAGDPTFAYRELLAGGIDGLVIGAPVLFEAGIDTAEPLADLAERHADYGDVTRVLDIAGKCRVLRLRRCAVTG